MAWFDEAVFYHIYPLGMLGAPKQNDYSKPVHRLREMEKWLPVIKRNGFNAIYIGPLFKSVGHGYETTDYMCLDNRLGDNEDLRWFVSECHNKGIKVILDGVFNHVGRDFFAFKDLKENRESSPYVSWFSNVNFWNNNEYNDGFSYDNWGGYNLLVKLNLRNPQVREYLFNAVCFWIKEFDIDGLRLDAADVLDFDFMKELRSITSQQKKDFWLMGEVIHGEYSRWANSETLHAVTDYTLHKALYSGHNDHNYFEIAHTVNRLIGMGASPRGALGLYNFRDNHDVERIITKLSNKQDFLPVHILLYTLPGVPSVYYGSEFGIEGRKERGSDDSLRPFLDPAVYTDSEYSNEFSNILRKLSEIRTGCPVLSYGSYRQLSLTTGQYMFARSFNEYEAVIAVNNSDSPAVITANSIKDGKYTGMLSGKEITVAGGYISVEISRHSGDIFLPESFDSSIKPAEKEIIIAQDNKEVSGPKEEPVIDTSESETVSTDSAAAKYGIGNKYSSIFPDKINRRYDYENMTIEELQVAILEKMAKNGPVTAQMIKTVMDNIYPDSLKNWVRSFR